MLDVLAFLLGLIIAFVVYNGVKFIGKFELGKIALTFYLVVNIASDFLHLLEKVLK